MTSLSEYAGLVDFDPTRIATDEPVDSSTVRDGVINNANHLVQSSAQQRVNWSALSGVVPMNAGGALIPSLNFGAYWPRTLMLPVASFGPFPMTLTPENRTAKMVIRLGGAVGNGTATFRARLSAYRPRGGRPTLTGPDGAPEEHAPNVAEATTASVTPVWLVTNPTYVQLSDPAEIAWATESVSMPKSLGGDPSSARVCLCTLDVWASGTDPASAAELWAVYGREYLG